MSHDLVLVIPCYNEQHRLNQSLIHGWSQRHPEWLWLFVDDGSLDETLQILGGLADLYPNVQVLALAKNSGKAEAVRQGMLYAHDHLSSPWYCYLDADFATPPAEIQRLHDLHKSGDHLLVMACRLKRLGANIQRKLVRQYGGRIGATLISMLLDLPTYDTQCGAKLLHADLVKIGFQEPFCSRWLFDVEVLARCRNHLGREALLRRSVEEPLLQWHDISGSKLKMADFLRVPSELWKIHRRYN